MERGGPYRVEWIEERDRFDAIAAPWDALADRDGLPFLRPAWFTSWWDAFSGPWRLRTCALWDDEELAGVFPLCVRGSDLHALANVHTPVFRPLARDEQALARLVAEVVASRPAELVVEALPVGAPAVALLERSLRQGGRRTLLEPQHVSPFVEIRGDVSAYVAGLSANTRGNLQRRRRKMIRERGAEFVLVETPSDLEDELRRGFAVEALAWKGQRGTAIVSHPDTLTFYNAVARAFHARGSLRTSSLWLDGRLAAFDLCLLEEGRLFLLKTGFDPDFRSLAPGLVMRLAVLERCFELGLESHELLGDDEAWKQTFATGERPHCVVRSYGRTPVSAGRFLYRRFVRPRLKSVYRRVRPGLERRG